MSAAIARQTSRWRVVHWFAAAIGVLVVVVVAGLVVGLVALSHLGDDRRRTVDVIDPAIATALRLSSALLDEETGVRGYAQSGTLSFLEPYTRGRAAEPGLLARLRRLALRSGGNLDGRVVRVATAADAWRTGFADRVIAQTRAGRKQFALADLEPGKARFDAVRVALAGLQGHLRAQRAVARQDLDEAANTVRALYLAFGLVLLASVLAAWLLLQRVVVAPIGRLAGEVREVAAGDFERTVNADGAREVVTLGQDVEAMRTRILLERDELRRSNAELEQFAYVASHDLQEPLRKVASFTQMLQRRYGGQLDERADTYIEFAVDGAKRMQELINDLLAFSRVGRLSEPEVVVDCNELVARARASLSGLIEQTSALVVADHLPAVRGEASLLALVFQNLIGNGLKFRGDAPPRVTIVAERDGDQWRFTVADNGIGIEPEYADRIFVIFQRLHPRTSYEGTGIGLAMCRKIVEYHGGRIWLDTERRDGATFHFTLPAINEPHPEADESP